MIQLSSTWDDGALRWTRVQADLLQGWQMRMDLHRRSHKLYKQSRASKGNTSGYKEQFFLEWAQSYCITFYSIQKHRISSKHFFFMKPCCCEVLQHEGELNFPFRVIPISIFIYSFFNFRFLLFRHSTIQLRSLFNSELDSLLRPFMPKYLYLETLNLHLSGQHNLRLTLRWVAYLWLISLVIACGRYSYFRWILF